MKNPIKMTFLAITLIAFAACNSEKNQWESAQKTGTINGYELFLVENPNSEFAQKATEEIWNLSVKKDSLDLFEKFLNKHPDSKFKDNALEKIWIIIQKNDCIESYESFIHGHPHSKYEEKAIDEIWRLYEEKNTITDFEKFISEHPNSKYDSKAKEAIKNIWASLKPNSPIIEIKSDMSLSLSWDSFSNADSYIVYWSGQKDFVKTSKNSESVNYTSFSRSNANTYGDRLNLYYRITAMKDGNESAPSEPIYAKLLSSNGGTRCQICGASSVGYCHLRDIHVCSSHNNFYTNSGTYMRCP